MTSAFEMVQSGDDKGNKKDPFQATKIWDSILSKFRKNMPLKKHRAYLRYYEQSFSGKEAVDFMMSQLPALLVTKKEVTRKRCQSLLSKIMDLKVFFNVRKDLDTTFRDDDTLYKFGDLFTTDSTQANRVQRSSSVNENDLRMLTRNNISPTIKFSRQQLEVAASSDTDISCWRMVLINLLKDHLDKRNLSYVLPSLYSDTFINFNCSQIGSKGIVSSFSPKHDIDICLMKMMRFLARFPLDVDKYVGIDKTYQGLEQDTYRSIVVQLKKLSEGEAMIDKTLSHALIACFKAFTEKDVSTVVRLRQRIAESDYFQNEATSKVCTQIVAYILDNEREIFAIPEELTLSHAIYLTDNDYALATRQKVLKTGPSQMLPNVYNQENKSSQCLPSYSNRISLDDYERQRVKATEDNLTSLLSSIVSNSNESEKKKLLKAFKKEHPAIYFAKFPNDHPEVMLPMFVRRVRSFLL
uniref:DEP domain-containing protein n=1 Tax=Rhabditophanes sp. KR3021 TaxID=114890 RepID=A0AC35U143_9BILA